MNDISKKGKQFMMGVMTVFLTVSFITFLGGIGQLGPITTLKTALYHSGDFDVMFRGRTELIPTVVGNTNYYTDENDFFNAPYLTRSEQIRLLAQRSLLTKVPTVNFTELQEIQYQAYESKGHQSPIDLFPRWLAFTTLYNPQDRLKSTTANMIAGDSELELKLNIAPLFPAVNFQRNELATTNDVLKILGLEQGQQVEAHYDLFQLLSKDFLKLKRLVFHFQEDMYENQGDAILDFLHLPKELTIRLKDIIKMSDIRRIHRNMFYCITKVINFIEAQESDEIPASGLIETLIPCFSEDMFTLKQTYTITVSVDQAQGKWPESIGNSFFIDSKWLIPDFQEMLNNRLKEILDQHTKDSKNSRETFDELSTLLMKRIDFEKQNDYSFAVLGKLHNREEMYIYGINDQLIHSYNLFFYHFRTQNYQVRSPMFSSVEKFEYVNFQLGAIFFTIIFFLFLIDGILIYSIMLNDVEERTYEFAMLRTLGFKNSSLVTLLVVQACFQSIPATIIGFVLLYIFTFCAQIALSAYMGVHVAVKLHWTMVVLGIVTGIVVPMLSNIYPIKQALGTSLRNALDRFRAGVDEISVEFVRMENAGTSPTQMAIGFSICLSSALTLYFIPRAILDSEVKKIFFDLNLLLVACVIGIVFIGQAFAKILCKWYIDLILMFAPNDRKLGPLIYKNLDSHSLKNLKANLLYSVTICFLIFQATNFQALFKYNTQLTDVIFGGDINVLAVDRGSIPKFDEMKIRAAIKPLLAENGGKVISYSINSAQIKRQFYSPTEDTVKEFIKGDGLKWSSSKLGNVFTYGVEPNLIDSLRIQEAWWPSEFLEQPFGQGTKIYEEVEVIKMLYDIEEASKFSQTYDTLEIISGQPNKGLVVNTQIINTLTSEGLRGEIFQNVGDYFTYCISTDKPRIFGEVIFKANTCQVKFKMRAVAIWNKLPGFFRISGYQQIAKGGPAMLMSQGQMLHIIDRVTNSYYDLDRIRKKVLLENEPATFGLIKENIQVKVLPGTTRDQRLQISNSLLSVIDDANIVLMDAINMSDDMSKNMKIVDFFSACTSTICFILGMFQLIMTISANIKDSMWELGVLRSMGCTRSQITRVMVYELISNTLSAITLGFITGTIVAALSIAQFYTMVELPLRLLLPTTTMAIVGICAVISLVAGSIYGTTELFSRNIASILKGC